jgi:8-amino-7-oxononanoate synthase
MGSFGDQLSGDLAQIEKDNLFRQLRTVHSPQGAHIVVQDRPLLNFSSNDYLGLATHPVLKQAAIQAVEKYGTGSGASRLICGSLLPHQELEQTLAAFKGTPAALSFTSGYAAALGTIGALVGKGDVVIADRLAHACLVDAARLSGATLRAFAHNDLTDLERILQWAISKDRSAVRLPTARAPRVLVITESVFSMDGDQAPLRQLVELKNKYGAWLMVDEAHATGVFGERGGGLAQAEGLTSEIEVQMGTFSKALGVAGGYIAGSDTLKDLLVNRARSFIFSTAPPPSIAAAAAAALRLVQGRGGVERRRQLWQNVARLRCGLGLEDIPGPSAIVPLVVGAEARATSLAADLFAAGFFVPAIRFPTVRRNQARLRITVTAAHEPKDIDFLVRALRQHSAFSLPTTAS